MCSLQTMESSCESTFIESEEDEIFLGAKMPRNIKQAYAESGAAASKTLTPDRSLEVSTACLKSVAGSDHDGTEIQGTNLTEDQLSPMHVSYAKVGEKMPIGGLAHSPVMKCWQDESNEQASSAEKDMLLLALQQRFEKHKVDLPDLCDLNLDDTTAENDSCAVNFQDQSNMSLEFVANCSMPQLSKSSIDDSLTSLKLCTKSTRKTKDLDSTAKFLELEKSCMTLCKPDDDCRESLLELSSDDLSTVSADADGGFLTTFTNLALIYPTLDRDNIAVSPFPTAVLAHSDLGTIPERKATCKENFTSHDREAMSISTSPLVVDKSIDEQFSEDSSSELSLNTTFDDILLLEAYGAHYMMSAEKDLIRKGLENSINVSLSKDQQDILDSFAEQKTSKKPGVMRDISKEFQPCTSMLAMAPPIVKDVIESKSCVTSAVDFQFPKPLSTVSGSQSKTKYRHRTTPMKQASPKTVSTEKAPSTKSGKFFSSSSVKSPLLAPRTKFFAGSPLNNPSRENTKSRMNGPASSSKMTADLKKIQSPIGHYIHDSPVPSLMTRKHVPFAGLQKNNNYVHIETKEEKKASENIDFNNMALPPQKSYQTTSSLKKMTPSKTRLPLLSGKTKQLVSTPKAMVIKHTGRVKASDLPSSSPLSKMPAKINDSCLSEKTLDAEVSVVVAKEATKTSSIK